MNIDLNGIAKKVGGTFNKVGNSALKSVNKMVANIPLEYAYVGFLVSKGMTLENRNVGNKIIRDLFLYTYISVKPSFFALMEDGTYNDLETGIKYKKLTFGELISKHIARGETIDMTQYPSISKNDAIGVFNLTKFEEIVDKVINAELNSKDINLKVATKKKNSYTLVEMEGIYRRYKKEQSTVNTFIVPPLLMDELDDIKTVYTLESNFMYEYYGKSDGEVYNDLQNKAIEYLKIKDN